MKKIFALFILFLIISCSPCRYVSKHPECFKVDSTTIDTLTVVTESVQYLLDSSTLDLYLQCDSNYNVLIQDFSNYQPNEKIKIVYKYKTNHLKIKSFADSVEILNTLVEKYKNEKTYILNPVNVQLEKDKDKYKEKLKSRNWLWWYFGSSVIILIIFLYFKIFY